MDGWGLCSSSRLRPDMVPHPAPIYPTRWTHQEMRTKEFSWPLFVHKETQSQWQSHTSVYTATQWLYCADLCPRLCGVFSWLQQWLFSQRDIPGSKPLEFQSPGVAHGRSFQGQVALSNLLFSEPCLSSTGDGLLIAGQVRRPGLGVMAIKASDVSLVDVLGNGAGHTVTGSHMVEAKAAQL